MAVEARVGDRPEPRAGGMLGAALAAVVLFSVVYVAPVLWIVATVAPFPLAVHRLNRGLASGLLATLLAATLVAWLFTPLQAAKFLLVLALPGLLIVEAVVRGRGLRRGVRCGLGIDGAHGDTDRRARRCLGGPDGGRPGRRQARL